MNESIRKLFLFTLIFIFSSIAIFLIINQKNNKPLKDQQISNPNLPSKYHDEISQLLQMLADDPDNTEILNHLGNLYYDLNLYENSIEFYDKSLKLEPANPFVLTDCAVMYFKVDNYEKALEYLDRAIKLKPDFAQAYYNKGLILITARNDHQQAVAVWEEYLKQAPESNQAAMFKEQIESVMQSTR